MLAINATRPQARITAELTRSGPAERIDIYNWAKFDIPLTATSISEVGNVMDTGNFGEM
jgi:hypothetical protein